MEVATVLASARNVKMSPEERVRWIERFVDANREAFDYRQSLEVDLLHRQKLLRQAETGSRTLTFAGATPEERALEEQYSELATASRVALNDLAGLAPQDRIAAVERIQSDLQRNQEQIQEIQTRLNQIRRPSGGTPSP
jgi:hypothetical protein